jgi:hypothetical protein
VENFDWCRIKTNIEDSTMIYNDKLTSEYGIISGMLTRNPPVKYNPVPTKEQYQSGILIRYFVKKVNEDKIIEIDPSKINGLDKNLYVVVSLNWKISGSKEKKIVNGIVEKSSVSENNAAEINRVKIETEVDLSFALSNLVEYWRGY